MNDFTKNIIYHTHNLREKSLIPCCVTTGKNRSLWRAIDIKLCYIIKYPYVKFMKWDTRILFTFNKKGRLITEIVDEFCKKLRLPFLADIKRGDVVTPKHIKILESYGNNVNTIRQKELF